jgi:hypothetical protein
MSFVKQTFSPCKLGVTHWGMLPFYRELLLNWSLCNYREMAALCNPYFFFFFFVVLEVQPGELYMLCMCSATELHPSLIPIIYHFLSHEVEHNLN